MICIFNEIIITLYVQFQVDFYIHVTNYIVVSTFD